MNSHAQQDSEATLGSGVPVVVPSSASVEPSHNHVADGQSDVEPASYASGRKSRRRTARSNRRTAVGQEQAIEKTVGSAMASARLCPDENADFQLQIDSYQELEELGRGGWGVVQRAFDRRLQREVAIKSLSAGVASLPDIKKQFEHEAKITSQLQHPGIVPVHERGTTPDGKSFYAMKVLEGSSLRDVIHAAHGHQESRGKKQLRERFLPLLPRFISVCNAVAFAHAKGVVHRDLKPANVMVGEFGETIVVDWGLAARIGVAEAKEEKADSATELVGTPAYMSPEQAKGSAESIAATSDIYSLGVMLFEMVAGVSPCVWAEKTHGSKDENRTSTERVLDRVINGRLPMLTAVNPLAPKSLEAVCRKAMAANPEDRYQSADELANEVCRFIEGGVPKVYAEPLVDKAIRWCTNHKAITLTSLAATLILLVASLIFGVVISEAHSNESAARRAAELSREKALARLAQARQSADTWLIDLSGALQFYPGMEALRGELLRSALDEYRGLLAKSPSGENQGSENAGGEDSPISNALQNLERARLLIRVHDVKRLIGTSEDMVDVHGGTAHLVEASLLLSEAEQFLSGLRETTRCDTGELAKQIRLERVNVCIAHLLIPGTEVADDTIAAHRNWLAHQLSLPLRPARTSASAEGDGPLPEMTRKHLSALVRLGIAASRQHSSRSQRLKYACDAAKFARVLVHAAPTDATLRQFETAMTSVARLREEEGDASEAARVWQELSQVLKRAPSPARSDRLQSLAFALMNQASDLAATAPLQSRALFDEAIEVLYRAWDAVDPSNFFEMNLATANYNSAKLMLADSRIQDSDAIECIESALGYYESSLRQSPTSDSLRRLAECHLLLAQIQDQSPSMSLKHCESSSLALRMLVDHDLAETADYLLIAETQLTICRLRLGEPASHLAYELAEDALAAAARGSPLPEPLASKVLKLSEHAAKLEKSLQDSK